MPSLIHFSFSVASNNLNPTSEEFQKYITGTTSLNDKTLFEMLYYCGLRRGECRGLQWSDIDWKNKQVSITKQANSVKDSQKYYELTPPKTSKSIKHYLLLISYTTI